MLAYYSADAAWNTPILTFATGDVIGSAPGTLTAGTPDTGTDFTVIGATFANVSQGTSDLVVTFTVGSSSGGTVGAQRFYGAVLEGEKVAYKRGSV